MTREEASFILANIDRRVCDDELSDALDVAIEALSAEPCEDAISRAEALKNLALTNNKDDVYRMLTRLSAVTPQPKMGKLIRVVTEKDYLGNETYHYKCSECGFKSFFGTERYCQNCGARMEVEHD